MGVKIEFHDPLKATIDIADRVNVKKVNGSYEVSGIGGSILVVVPADEVKELLVDDRS